MACGIPQGHPGPPLGTLRSLTWGHSHLPASATTARVTTAALPLPGCPRVCTASASPLCSLAEWLHQSPPTWVPSRSSSSLGPKFKQSPSATNSSPCTSWPLVFPFPTADLLQALILNKNKARPKPNQKNLQWSQVVLFDLVERILSLSPIQSSTCLQRTLFAKTQRIR